jgi:protein-disulfide isomerase
LRRSADDLRVDADVVQRPGDDRENGVTGVAAVLLGSAEVSTLAERLGIPAEQIRDVLATDRYADAVRADHNAAVSMGARGVPFTVLGQRLGIPGAVTVDQYTQAINEAWEQTNG